MVLSPMVPGRSQEFKGAGGSCGHPSEDAFPGDVALEVERGFRTDRVGSPKQLSFAQNQKTSSHTGKFLPGVRHGLTSNQCMLCGQRRSDAGQ